MKKKIFFILLTAVLMIILTVTASAENVKYIDENGVEQTADCIIITSQADFSFERDNK